MSDWAMVGMGKGQVAVGQRGALSKAEAFVKIAAISSLQSHKALVGSAMPSRPPPSIGSEFCLASTSTRVPRPLDSILTLFSLHCPNSRLT